MSVPLPPGTGIENIDPEQIKTVIYLVFVSHHANIIYF